MVENTRKRGSYFSTSRYFIRPQFTKNVKWFFINLDVWSNTQGRHYIPKLKHWVLCRESDKLTNPLLNLFTSIDIVFIFEVVLSLIALIFAYDAIAGERERGTLRLVVTHPVRRGQILLAKYISAMLCLLVPCMVSAYEEIKQIWEAFDRERKQFLVNDAVPGEDPHFGMVGADPNFNQIWGSGYHYEYFHRDSSTLRYDYHSPESIPTFEDTLSLSRDFNAAVDLLLLTLFFVVFFSGAFLAFVRIEI